MSANPWLQVSIDAIGKVSHVARAVDVQESRIGWGLVQLWEWCWRTKTDRVSTVHLKGFFGLEASEALAAFGFLEAVAGGLWRVRGADKYLRIAAGQKKGGEASKGNLLKGRPSRARAGGGAGTKPETEPGLPLGSPSGSLPASTANSEQRTANSLETTPAPEAARDGWQELIRALDEEFEAARGSKYPWAADKKAFSELKKFRPQYGDEEIKKRWRRGLKGNFARQVHAVSDLLKAAKWNALATDEVTLSTVVNLKHPQPPSTFTESGAVLDF